MKKTYDLEERTYEFARDVRFFIKTLKNTIANVEDSRQVVKSSGSVGANYIEANEKLGDKDFKFRVKISRKEAKESVYWLRLIRDTNEFKCTKRIDALIQEAIELKRILSAIIDKS